VGLGPAPVVRLERALAHRETPSGQGKSMLAAPTLRRPNERTVAATTGQTGARGSRGSCLSGRQGDTPRTDHRFATGCGEPLAGPSERLLAFLATGPSPTFEPAVRGPERITSSRVAGDSPGRHVALYCALVRIGPQSVDGHVDEGRFTLSPAGDMSALSQKPSRGSGKQSVGERKGCQSR
jgi:hypothetical protein